MTIKEGVEIIKKELNLAEEIGSVFKDGFQLEDLIELARIPVRKILDLLPGTTPEEKERIIEQALLEAIEEADNLPGVLGFITDNPVVDQLEADAAVWAKVNIIRPVVRWAYYREAADPASPVTSDTLARLGLAGA